MVSAGSTQAHVGDMIHDTTRKLALPSPLTMEEVRNPDALRVRATSCASSPMDASDCSTRSAQSVRVRGVAGAAAGLRTRRAGPAVLDLLARP